MKTNIKNGWYASGEFFWLVESGKITDAVQRDTKAQHSYAGFCYANQIDEANKQLKSGTLFTNLESVEESEVFE